MAFFRALQLRVDEQVTLGLTVKGVHIANDGRLLLRGAPATLNVITVVVGRGGVILHHDVPLADSLRLLLPQRLVPLHALSADILVIRIQL